LVESRYLRKKANAPNVTIVMSILRRSQISSFEYLLLGYQLKMYLKMPSGVLIESGSSVSGASVACRAAPDQADALGLVGVVDADDDLLGLAVGLGGDLGSLALLALHLERARTRLGSVHLGWGDGRPACLLDGRAAGARKVGCGRGRKGG
jgi:hypothetical protein